MIGTKDPDHTYPDSSEPEVLFFTKRDDTTSGQDVYGRYRSSRWEFDAATMESRIRSNYLYFDGSTIKDPAGGEVDGTPYDVNYGRMVINGTQTYTPVTPNGNIIVKHDSDSDAEYESAMEVFVKVGATDVFSSPENTLATDENNTTIDNTKSQTTVLTSSQLEETFGVTNFQPIGKISRVAVDLGGNSTQQDPQTVKFSYDLNNLSGTASDFKLMKLIGKNTYKAFSYATEDKLNDNLESGDWWLTDLGGNYIAVDDSLSSTDTYTVNFKVQDESDFDLADGYGPIEDPTVLGTTADTTSDDTSSDDGSSSSSSSGCFINTLIQ